MQALLLTLAERLGALHPVTRCACTPLEVLLCRVREDP